MKKLIALACICLPWSAFADDTMLLMRKNHCFMCHSVSNKLVGPSFSALAYLYKSSGYNLSEEAERMRAKLRAGGKMPPKVIRESFQLQNGPLCSPAPKTMSDDEIKQAVDWILALR